MRKKTVIAEERKPEGNNWELPEYPAELKDIFDVLPDEKKEKIFDAWQKITPEIRDKNPVWKFTETEKGMIFIFRNGQKVRQWAE